MRPGRPRSMIARARLSSVTGIGTGASRIGLDAVGRQRLDGPRQAAPLGLLLRLLRRFELGLGVHQSVLGKVAAVLPEIAPDAENAFERLSDDAGREGLEGDRSLVARLHQRPEHAGEIDRPRAHVAAMGIAGVEIAEIVAGL